MSALRPHTAGSLTFLGEHAPFAVCTPVGERTRARMLAAGSSSTTWSPAGWPHSDEVFATLVTDSDPSMPSSLQALASSLLQTGTTRPLVILSTCRPGGAIHKAILRTAACHNASLVDVPPIANPSTRRANRWADSYAKLNIFRAPVRKLVYLDADTLVLRNIDTLFGLAPSFAAVADLGRACGTAIRAHARHRPQQLMRFVRDCRKGLAAQFNTGLMVVSPSRAVFDAMMVRRTQIVASDGSDQGFLNAFFAHEWRASASAQLPLRFNRFANEERAQPGSLPFHLPSVSVLHFVGELKPARDAGASRSAHPKSAQAFSHALASRSAACS